MGKLEAISIIIDVGFPDTRINNTSRKGDRKKQTTTGKQRIKAPYPSKAGKITGSIAKHS